MTPEQIGTALWHAKLETALLRRVMVQATAEGWHPHTETLHAATRALDGVISVLEVALAEGTHPAIALDQWLALEALASLTPQEER
jgi:hypothetical protein